MTPTKKFLVLLVPLLVLFAGAAKIAKADDTTPPVITAPADQSFATTTIPASPTLVPATATDDTDPHPVITYAPLLFPLGTTQVLWTATDASGNFATTTSNVTITQATPPAQHVSLTIRDGDTTAFSGNVVLPDHNSVDLSITSTDGAATATVSPRSVLGVLETLQASSTAFNITDLVYYSSFSPASFYINCIAIPAASSTPDCSDWTDVVNGSDPGIGIDHQLLQDGDVVYLYFRPHQTILSTSAVVSGQSFTATAEQYDYVSGTYKPLTGVIIGVGTPHTYPVPFAELATSTVDVSGQAMFTLNATGTFAVGIKDDFYFPTVPITVTDVPVAPPSGTNGGGGIGHSNLNIPSALTFIAAGQSADGSFGSSIVTDWTAVALAAADKEPVRANLKKYLQTAAPTMSNVTDYERHAMALEALGINPYSGASTDYISPIANAFDGTQIGDKNLDNDDIFAIFPLLNAGYGPGDPVIQKEAAFIVAAQQPDGSWDESPDMTAAAAQAVGSFFGVPNVSPQTLGQTLGMADHYLRSTQKTDGGWGNVDSTSWVIIAENATKQGDPAHYVPTVSAAGYLPTDALAGAQQPDGGVQSPNRVWSTGYAVVAASGQSWLSLLQPFAKPAVPNIGGGGTVFRTATSTATSTLPTLTPVISTSTPPSVTSTVPVLPFVFPTVTTTPTTTLPVLSTPKFKPHKPVVKPIIAPGPQVLGTTTFTPSDAKSLQPAALQPQPSADHPGFFGRIWQAIASFFKSIF